MHGILIFCGDFDGDTDVPVNLFEAGVDTFVASESRREGVCVDLCMALFLSADTAEDLKANNVAVTFFTEAREPLDIGFREKVTFAELHDLRISTGKGRVTFPAFGRYMVEVVVNERQVLDRRPITITDAIPA